MKMKKLRLSKETLRHLTQEKARTIVGGDSEVSCFQSCDSCTCTSCGYTCGASWCDCGHTTGCGSYFATCYATCAPGPCSCSGC